MISYLLFTFIETEHRHINLYAHVLIRSDYGTMMWEYFLHHWSSLKLIHQGPVLRGLVHFCRKPMHIICAFT